MKRAVKGLWGCALAVCGFAAAFGGVNDVVSEVKVYKVDIQGDGQETLTRAWQVSAGDVLEYQLVYSNAGKQSVKGLHATFQVPSETEYLESTASPKTANASLDGKRFESMPLMRPVVSSAGEKELRAVPYGEYRYLQWELGTLKKGESAVVSARMRVK